MSVSGPTMVRRQLGMRLRQARRDSGKTVEEVVSSGTVSKATLHRYEAGRSAMTPGTVLELCFVYNLDRVTTEAMRELAVGSLERGWWEDRQELLKAGVGLYFGLESVASGIDIYQPNVVDGLLQTAGYASAVERAHVSNPDEQTVTGRVAIRLKRQRMLFERKTPIALRVVLGPGVLGTVVGGPSVMGEQIAHLHELAREHQAEVRVLTGEPGAHAAMAGGFTLMTFDDPDDPPVAYVETAVGANYFEQPVQVEQYRRIFASVFEQSDPIEGYQP